MAIIYQKWVPKRQEQALREQRASNKLAAEHKSAQCGTANLSSDTTTTIPKMSTPLQNAWATGRLQEQIQASASPKAHASKGQEKDRAASGVSGPSSNKTSAPQKAQPSKGQEKERAASGVSGPNKENVVPTAEAKGKWPQLGNATRDEAKKQPTAEMTPKEFAPLIPAAAYTVAFEGPSRLVQQGNAPSEAKDKDEFRIPAFISRRSVRNISAPSPSKLTVAPTVAPVEPVPTLLKTGLQGGKLSMKGSHTSLAAISDNSFDTNPFPDDGTPRTQVKDQSSGVPVADDGMPRADSKDQSPSDPASPKSHSSDDAPRGFLATEKFPDFIQLPEKPLLGTIKPATHAKFNAYLARGGKEDEAYAGKWSRAEDGVHAGKKSQAGEGPQRAPKTEGFLSIRESLPTVILIQFFYGQNYADKSHSALISLTIPPCPPGPNSPYKPITCEQLIEAIERKANFPGPRGRLAKKLRTVHVVWQTPAEGPNYTSPTPIVETLPRSVAGRVGTVALSHQPYSDPRHYYYGGTPIPDYPLDEQGRRQMGPGLTQRGGVGYYDDHGNYKVTPYEQQPQMYPANFYHGETTSPSKWEKQGWYKSDAPTGKWADLTMLQDIELWNMLKQIETRSPTPNLTVVFEVEDMYDR